MTAAPAPIRCVVWDLDGTLLDGVLLESAETAVPRRREGVDAALTRLHERGIVHSIASRNPPGLAAAAVAVAGFPVPFLAPQYGWDAKPAALRRIAAALDLDLDTFAFVDDETHERREVAAALPQVLVLSPGDIEAALAWPRFRPAVVTDQARRRAQSYLDRQRRDAAGQAFAGSREEFHRHCRTTVALRPARRADLPRLVELAARTRRFNSAGAALSGPPLAACLASARHRVVCAEVRDRFGDDGLVGAVVLAVGGLTWTAELVMMSCRATGRGVIDVLLAGVAEAAARGGATQLAVPVMANERNLPLRLALRAAGFSATMGSSTTTGSGATTGGGGHRVTFTRPVPTGAAMPAGLTASVPAGITMVSTL